MSQECQILFLMVLICMAIPVVSSDENCERIEIKKEWSVTCDSQTHQRDYCVPGQRVNDPCSNNVCEYCPAGQFQNVYTNCKTCKNCTTLNDCCPGQELIRQCKSYEDAKCGCPVCPEEQTPTRCPTCPTVCNMTTQASTSDDTPVSSLSDTDGTTSLPTSAKDTLSSDCKCVGWITGFSVVALLCTILFCVVVCLCLKGNGAPPSPECGTTEEATGLVSLGEKPSNDSESENEQSLIIATLKEENGQLRDRIAELEKRIQQSERSKREISDSVDAADVIQKDKIDAGSISQQSSLERDLNSAPVESDGTTMPAEHQKAQRKDSTPIAASANRDQPSSANNNNDVVSEKDHEGDNTASATTTNMSGPSSANRERAEVVRKD